jgi:two-component system response regulator LytT
MEIVIIEDERVAARRLKRLTLDILGESETEVVCCESFEEARRYLADHSIDVMLLDLNLNGKDGFDLLSDVTSGSFHTIVVSANTSRAIEAFEYGVLDFVPKPLERERLAVALGRLRQPAQRRETAARFLSVKTHGSIRLIPVEEVVFLKGAGDYVEIHCSDGTVELHSKSLETLESILPARFYRIHKSYIIDSTQIERIQVHGGGKYEVVLHDNVRLPLSRARYRDFQQALGQEDTA